MLIGTQLLQHTVYRYRGPVWVDDIDSVHYRHRSLSRTVMISSGIYMARLGHILHGIGHCLIQ